MNTHIFTAYKVTSALVLAVVTTGIFPASTVYANSHASDNGRANRSTHAVANGYGLTKKQVSADENPQASVQVTPDENSPATVANQAAPRANVAAHTAGNPSGNNGFIKVNEEVVPDSIPNNDPHVGCNLKVEFYNYDKNPDYKARVSFALHNPTAGAGYTMSVAGDQNPFIGEDVAGGGNDLDAAKSYKLSFSGTPHAKQGYHVKLTIHADGSRGADVKHKVFWVQPCQEGHVLGSTPQTPGKTLSASTTAPQALPDTLPSTGSNNWVGLVVASFASLAAYALTFRFQKSREF